MADLSTPKNYDIIIIGAGVVGSLIALELSRYDISAAVLEKHLDVGQETSSRNSGVVHAGFNYTPDELRGKLCVKGNEMLHSLAESLGVEFDVIGKLTIAKDEEDVGTLHRLKEQGEANGVPGLEIVSSETINKIEPAASGLAALYSPTSSIINPYQLTINAAETALYSGVNFFLNTQVTAIEKTQDGFRIKTSGSEFSSKVLINCAGLYADKICSMLGISEYTIYPCKGEYFILDRQKSGFIKTLLYPTPRKNEPGLGIHLTPTTRGNIMVGPSAEYCSLCNDYSCTRNILGTLVNEAASANGSITPGDFIRHFSGLRPKLTPPEVGGNADFVIEDRPDVTGLINLVGIESPGLTASPAIAHMILPMIETHLPLSKKGTWAYQKPKPKKYRDMSEEERISAVEADPGYGEIVCRCEQVTRAELIAAWNNPLGAKSLRSIKMRTGAMMGRCQSGFCLPKITNVLQQEFSLKPEDIMSNDSGTQMFETLRKCQ